MTVKFFKCTITKPPKPKCHETKKCHDTKKFCEPRKFHEIKKCVEFVKPKCPPKFNDGCKPIKCFPNGGGLDS